MTRWKAIVLTLSVAFGFHMGGAYLGGFGGEDLDRFEAQSGINLPDWYAAHPALLTWTRGDGATFVTLAIDPSFDGASNNLLSGGYRFQRIGFALAGRLAVLGNADLVPIGLAAVNLFAMGWYATLVAELGRSDRRLLWLLANPALYLGFSGNTAEPVGLALALAAGVASSAVTCVVLGALLGSTRPSYATILPAGRRPVIATAAAAGSFVFVAIVGRSVTTGGGALHSFSIPGVGYWTAITDRPLSTALMAITALAALITTLVYGIQRVPGSIRRVAWVATALLGLSLSVIVMNNPINLLRALGALPVLWALDTWTTSRKRAPDALR